MERYDDWYKRAVVYQIYPKSFYDSNGDGIGDIQGIISKLDYLADLGVNTVWLSPCYKSPNDDNGYDISDYRDIGDEYGTMDDFRKMLQEMHKRGIRLLMDLVVNHTSDEHAWFIESRKSKDNRYRDYYIWKDGKDGKEPNDWLANFGGSVWKYDEITKQYYLHLFSEKQPDLNWENPVARSEIIEMINFWLDLGVDGFRCDVINSISKDFSAKNYGGIGPHLHTYLHELNRKAFAPHRAMTVGETWGLTPDQTLDFIEPGRQELTMTFQFDHICCGWDGSKFSKRKFSAERFVELLAQWQYGLDGKGWNTLFSENHDLPRSVSQFGDETKYVKESAKMLAVLIYCMQGTPYIYQGQELGLVNPHFNDISEYRDIETINAYKEMKDKYSYSDLLKMLNYGSRDNARVPMPWDNTENTGFTSGKPWIKAGSNYALMNVKQEQNARDSVLFFYKKLFALRKSSECLLFGDFKLLKNENNVCIYERNFKSEKIIVFCLFGDNEQELANSYGISSNDVLLTNYTDSIIGSQIKLRPYEAIIVRIN